MKANSNIVLSDKEKTKMKKELEKTFKKMLQIMKFDTETDQQILDTPRRMAKMYVDELFSGCYTAPPKITTFDNVEGNDDMVILGPIAVKSCCSHHIIPFMGQCWIGYLPTDKVVGISKLARIVKWFMRRPQIQEELTKQIADFVIDELKASGVAVYMEAQHLCMVARGVEENNSWMKTSAVRGVFATDHSAKAEFLNLIK